MEYKHRIADQMLSKKLASKGGYIDRRPKMVWKNYHRRTTGKQYPVYG